MSITDVDDYSKAIGAGFVEGRPDTVARFASIGAPTGGHIPGHPADADPDWEGRCRI